MMSKMTGAQRASFRQVFGKFFWKNLGEISKVLGKFWTCFWEVLGKFQASFGHVFSKFLASFGHVSKMVKIVKMVKLVENGKNAKYIKSSTGACR